MLLCALCGEFLLKEKSEVESEAYFQSELRQITVFETQIIIDSRFDGNSPCQEKRIASLRTEGKVDCESLGDGTWTFVQQVRENPVRVAGARRCFPGG